MKLSTQSRNDLPSSSFALPGARRFPLEDQNHAKAALIDVNRAKGLTDEEKVEIIKKAHAKLKSGK